MLLREKRWLNIVADCSDKCGRALLDIELYIQSTPFQAIYSCTHVCLREAYLVVSIPKPLNIARQKRGIQNGRRLPCSDEGPADALSKKA